MVYQLLFFPSMYLSKCYCPRVGSAVLKELVVNRRVPPCVYCFAGFIHFNEFLAATIQQRQLDEAQLWPAFDRLDRSHTGFINLDDVTLTTGVAATKQEAAVLVGYFDNNGDGQVRKTQPSLAHGRQP